MKTKSNMAVKESMFMSKTGTFILGKEPKPKELQSWQIDKQSQERQDKVGLEFTHKAVEKFKPKELDWEIELINSGKHLADILEQYNGNRQCKLCGAEPEKQSEWVIFLVKKLLTQQRTELLEEIKKIVPKWIDNPLGEVNSYTVGRRDERLEIREKLLNLLNKKDD